MRALATIRTFVMSYMIPGWGFWIVGKPKLAIATTSTIIGIALLFSWSRLVLNPIAFILYAAVIVALLLTAAFWSAIIEYRRNRENPPPRNWKSAFVFALVGGAAFYLLMSERSTILGYDIFTLPSESMAPTLTKGDYILIDTWHYSDSEIEVGDLAVFEVPEMDGVNYVKRIVGVPGNELTFEDDAVIRNGIRLEEPYAFYSDKSGRPGASFPSIKVPDGEYFVLGDNRNNSRDSRYLGPIPESAFVGRVEHIWYSRSDADGVRWERFPAKPD